MIGFKRKIQVNSFVSMRCVTSTIIRPKVPGHLGMGLLPIHTTNHTSLSPRKVGKVNL